MTHFIFGQHFLKRMLVLTGLLLNVGGQLIAQSICLSSHNDYVFEGTSNAQCIDYGDFDNNGVKDIVEGNFTSGTNKMVLIKGNANGTFQAPIPFEGNSRPLDVKAADFNLDGNLDVVVANQLDATISVVFGNGNGTFQTPVTYTTSLSPNDIAIGDFNEDSYKDLAVSCLNGGVNIFFGSSVTFGQFTSGGYFATGAGARGVVTKDFNQDGNLDIATSNNSAASMTVIFGNGSGSFSGTVTIAAQTGAFSIISGDFNGD